MRNQDDFSLDKIRGIPRRKYIKLINCGKAHHLDKLFYWKKTLSVFSGSLLVPFDEAVSELSGEHPDAFFRASSERIEFHFEPKSEIVIFILRDGRLWLAALAVNSKLGLQALTQTILHAAEFGMKGTGFSDFQSNTLVNFLDIVLANKLYEQLIEA